MKKSRIKIAQIMAGSTIGGLEKHVLELSSGLAKTYDVTLIAPNSIRPYVDSSVNFEGCDLSRSRNNPLLLRDVLKLLQKQTYQIVHSHGSKPTQILSRIQFWKKQTYVATIHGQKNKTTYFNRADALIAVSNNLKKLVSNKNTYVIYNGIDTAQFSGIKHEEIPSFSQKQTTLCAVGRLVPTKGFDILIKAIKDIPVNLLIAGEGPEKDNLLGLIKKYDLEHRIKLLGFRKDIINLLKQSDGCVISSRKEGFSYVCAEALLSKRPVISTDVPVANEVLKPHLLCNVNDTSALSTLIKHAISDVNSWNNECSQAIKFAAKKFTLSKMVENTQEVYRLVLEKKNSR